MTSPPAETWDDDEDFDLSSSGNIALDLPRSEIGSHGVGDDHGGIADVEDSDNVGGMSFSILPPPRKDNIDDHNDGDIEDWEAEIDEDQVDTIKLSDLTNETLAQLASFRKQTSSTLTDFDIASLSIDNLSGKVTNLGSFAHGKSLLQDGVGEWDEDLEMPETFPSVLNLRQPSNNITTEIDLDMEEPSFDSTSDATTSGRSTSDVRKRSPTQSSFASKDEQGPRSSSSASRHSHLELSKEAEVVNRNVYEPSATLESTEIESSFELPESITQLRLTPHTGRVADLPTTIPPFDSISSAQGDSDAIHPKERNKPRYLNATAASRARQAGNRNLSAESSNLLKGSSSRILKVPKRARHYSDGRELDLIADLPTKAENDISQARFRRYGHTSQSPYMSPAVERANRGQKKGQRVEPTLIRNLSGPHVAPRTVGSMTWNPKLQRWEGNEEEGRWFENAVKKEERNVLARYSSGSGKVVSHSRLKSQMRGRSSPIASAAHHFAGAKVVGDMIFDPINLCWLNKNKEDEVDPFSAWEEKEDNINSMRFLNRLSNRPGKTRASSSTAAISSSSSHPSSSSSSFQGRIAKPTPWSAASINRVIKSSKCDAVPKSLSSRIPTQLWLDCIAAKTRHDEQVTGIVPLNKESTSRNRGSRHSTNQNSTPEHLYLIQKLARQVPDS